MQHAQQGAGRERPEEPPARGGLGIGAVAGAEAAEQLAGAVARAETAEHDLATWTCRCGCLLVSRQDSARWLHGATGGAHPGSTSRDGACHPRAASHRARGGTEAARGATSRRDRAASAPRRRTEGACPGAGAAEGGARPREGVAGSTRAGAHGLEGSASSHSGAAASDRGASPTRSGAGAGCGVRVHQ